MTGAGAGAGAGPASPGRPAPPLPAWLAAMMPPGARRSLIAVGDGLDVCVTEVGPAGGQPVLCMHGNPTWSFLYRRVAKDLDGSGLRLVLPDLIGLGFSTKPRDPALHTLDNHARWIRAVIESLALGPTILVGQDWGGPIGVLAFEGHTEDLAGLVVLNTVLSPPRPGFRPTTFHRFARLPVVSTAAFHLLGFPQNALATAQGDRTSIRGRVARAYRYPLRRRADRVAPLALARMVPDSLEHPSVEPLRRVREIVQGLTGPAEIVWGDADPVLGRARNWIAQLLPRAHVTRTAAGHFLQEEVPGPIAAAIRRVAAAAAGSSVVG